MHDCCKIWENLMPVAVLSDCVVAQCRICKKRLKVADADEVTDHTYGLEEW